MRLIDRSAQTNRWRTVPSGEKLLVAGLALATALVTHSVAVQLALLVLMPGLTLFGARVRLRDFLRAATVPLAFILTGLLAQLVTLRFAGGWPQLSLVSGEQLSQALFFLLRSLASVSALLFLALTTPLTRLIQWAEAKGLNAEIADIALLMFRMIWLLLDCLDRGETALKNRLGHTGFRRTLRSQALLLAALLPRVFSRARRMESGLAARGYDGRLAFLAAEDRAAPARLAGIAAGFSLLFAAGLFTALPLAPGFLA